MQYNDWLHIWLENYVKPTSKQKTYVRYSEIVSHHISGKLGEMELAELTPLVLQKFTTDLTVKGNVKTGKGLAPNSVNGIITVIQNSLNTACYTGQVSEYSADKIRRPKSSEKQITCFTSEEQKLIERAILEGGKTKLFGVVLLPLYGLAYRRAARPRMVGYRFCGAHAHRRQDVLRRKGRKRQIRENNRRPQNPDFQARNSRSASAYDLS